MNKKQKNILIWVLTWAGLLLAVLYSPLGSPDLYSSKQFYITNQSENFNGELITYTNRIDNTNKIEIKNNSRQSSIRSAANAEIVVANNYQSASKRLSIANVSNPYGKTDGNTVNTTQTSTNNQETNYNNNVSSGSAVGNDFYAYSGRNSKKSNNVNQESVIASLSNDLNIIPSITGYKGSPQIDINRLSSSSATDPGGDPFGKPIPIGDGWIFLIGLVLIYGFLKYRLSITQS